VPCFVRWPGKFPAGKTLNGIVSHQEWLPTLLAAAGQPDIVEELKAGYQAGDKEFRVHIDGYNLLPYLTGETDESPRNWFFYTSDDGLITAIRLEDWKAVFYEQRAKTMQLWAEPFVPLRLPKLFHLRRDPFERADENSNSYWDWILEHIFVMYPMQALAAEQLQSFAEFPPRQEPAAFNLDAILEQMTDAGGGGMH
jgi:arylsulfatase